jgi:glucose-6-phosphate isomerase
MTEPTPARSLALNLTLKDARLEAALAAARDRAVKESWADRAIGRRDPAVWSSEDVVQRAIATRLGWLEAPFHFADETSELEAFATALREGGYTTAVLGGMGGSSLAPALLTRVFGTAKDGTPVRVLDSTDPAAVSATLDDLEPTATLFIVSTKSGTTAETLSFQAYQWARIENALETAEASARSPTTTSCARSSSTRPTSAAAIRPSPMSASSRERCSESIWTRSSRKPGQ